MGGDGSELLQLAVGASKILGELEQFLFFLLGRGDVPDDAQTIVRSVRIVPKTW